MSATAHIPAQWTEVRDAVRAAARAAGRDPDAVRLIAVSKTHPAEAVVAAFEAGARDFGENRVEELEAKRAEVARLLGADAAQALRWHLIGQLQSRKVRSLGPVERVHTVDRASQLRAFAQRGPRQAVLLEVNVGEEPQKGGVAPDLLPAFALEAVASGAVEVRGVMAIPPVRETAAARAADFRAVRAALEAVQAVLAPEDAARCVELSMGMSADYPEAIAEGATWVRVGTAIFGRRQA